LTIIADGALQFVYNKSVFFIIVLMLNMKNNLKLVEW